MRINEAGWDRLIRVAAGVAILALTVVGPRTLWGLLGAVPLFTGLVGHCPLYRLVGMSTCPVGARDR
jgi:hypothetical protein